MKLVGSGEVNEIGMAAPLEPIIIPRAGLAAVALAAGATILFGLLPGLGSGVLSEAAQALVDLRISLGP